MQHFSYTIIFRKFYFLNVLFNVLQEVYHGCIRCNNFLKFYFRALELAVKNGNHTDTVLAFRKKHLEALDIAEDKPNFLQLAKEVSLYKLIARHIRK